MKTNLSSQITLTRIPTKYYRPENAFEHSVLTRLEKVPTTIYESAEEGSFAIAKEIALQIRKKQDAGLPFVLALPGGRSPESVYKELVRMHREDNLSFRNVVVFLEYEFYPLTNLNSGVYAHLKNELLDHVDILPENIHYPDAQMPKDAIFDYGVNEIPNIKESRAAYKAFGKDPQFHACPFDRLKWGPRRNVLLSITVTREGRFSRWITTTDVIETAGFVRIGAIVR